MNCRISTVKWIFGGDSDEDEDLIPFDFSAIEALIEDVLNHWHNHCSTFMQICHP